MVLFWITLLVALIGSNADGEFSILHTPESLAFVHTGETWESHLKEIFSAALGLSVEYSGLKTKIFPLIADDNEPHTFKGMQNRIKQHFGGGRNKVVNVKLFSSKRHLIIRRAFGASNVTGHKLNPLKLKYLSPTVEEDNQFLDELETLQTIIGKVRDGAISPDNLIDFYHLRYRTLHVLTDFYGPISTQTREAKSLLGDALKELNDVFVKAYDGSVLITVVTTDVAHSRRSARSVTIPPSSSRWPYQWLEPPLDWRKIPLKPKKISGRREDEKEHPNEVSKLPNVEKLKTQNEPSFSQEKIPERPIAREMVSEEDDEYQHDTPEHVYAIFNLFLWFGVSIGFSMLAVVYTCMDMDPGRNTIIYRLTTMRTTMKKER